MDIEVIKTQIEEATLDPDLVPDPFEPLDELLERAEEQDMLPLVLSVTESAILQDGMHPAHYYLYGMARFRVGNADAAYKAFVPIGNRFETEEQWNALGLLAARALENNPRVESALFLAKAMEQAGLDVVDRALLRRAYEYFPNESRLAYLMGESKRLEAEAIEGGPDSDDGARLMVEARFYYADALDGFVTHKKTSSIDDVVEKLSHAQHPDTLQHALRALRKLAEQQQWGRFQATVETLEPAFGRAGLLAELWRILLDNLAKAPASVGVRQRLGELAPQAFPEAEGIVDLLERTGILDPDKPVEAAMKELDPLLAFVPGFYILHASWGVGRIKSNDAENLIIDFVDNPNHRMSVNLARRALDVVPIDDLRVMQVERKDDLKAMTKDNHAQVVYLAIRQVGGQAKTQDLKRVITNGIIPTSRWAAWWKEAKSSMEDDGRFDLSQAFRQVYKLRSGTDSSDVAFPIVEPRRGIRPNLNLIRRFLDQHPSLTESAARMYTRILERWARTEKTTAEDRMAIHFQLYRWKPETSEEFHDALRDMLQGGVEASSFSDLEDQKLLTQVGLGYEDLWKQTVYFALSSRYQEVREMALEKLNVDKEVGRAVLRSAIEHPADHPMAAMAAINLATRTTDEDTVAPEIWHAALGAAMLIESTSREQVRKQAMTALLPEGVLAAKIAQNPPDETVSERFGFLLRKWRSSERYLQPVLKILRQAGLDSVVDEFRSEQMAKTNQILQTHAERTDYSGVLMTRISFERQKKDLEKLNFEVKTTVAQAIAKARELGDLRENAEYDAAKQKQADYMERISSLNTRLREARMLEDLKFPDDEVGPGTEVQLEEGGSGRMVTYWILGEGDGAFGSDVISYASPMGRQLIEKKIGDRVSVITEEGVAEYLIRGVTKKLPTAEVPAGPGN